VEWDGALRRGIRARVGDGGCDSGAGRWSTSVAWGVSVAWWIGTVASDIQTACCSSSLLIHGSQEQMRGKYQGREWTSEASGKYQGSTWQETREASGKDQGSEWPVPGKCVASTTLASGKCQGNMWQVPG
jgi:hypothetical protein